MDKALLLFYASLAPGSNAMEAELLEEMTGMNNSVTTVPAQQSRGEEN